MDPRIKNYLGWVSLLALIILTAVGVQAAFAYSRSALPVATFSATGEGRSVAIPDTAEFSFGLTTEGGKDVSALQKENTDKMNAAIDFVKSEGVDAKDIQTSNYNISPRYQYFSCQPTSSARPCPPSEIVGYTINQTITVKVRDFAKIGDILSGVAAKGANNVSGLNFTLHDKDAAENEARAEAISKAKTKAESMAQAGGFHIGRIISIQESGQTPSPIYYGKMTGGFGMGAADVAAAPSVQPGSNEIVKDVTITYEIR